MCKLHYLLYLAGSQGGADTDLFDSVVRYTFNGRPFFSAIHHVKHQDLFAKELLIANKAQMVFTRENKNIGCFHCK